MGAFLAQCSDQEKAGINFRYIMKAGDVIPLLLTQDTIPELPHHGEGKSCKSSDEEDAVADTVYNAQGVEVGKAQAMDSEQGRTGGEGDADTNNQAGPAEG